jgi:formylglycine-generating enzyme required for sulfatase activity
MLLFLVMASYAGQAQDTGFSFKLKNKPVKKTSGGKTIGAGQAKTSTHSPAEAPFLTLRITTDLDGKIYTGSKSKEGIDIKVGAPLELPLFSENSALFFSGPDGFTYKLPLSFTPDQRGSTAERVLYLKKNYQIYLKKQAEISEEARVLDGIFLNMQPIEPGDAMLPSFEISRFEITVGQYAIFANDPKAKHERNQLDSAFIIFLPSGERGFKVNIDWRHDAGGNLRPISEYDHPVANVSWFEADAFCAWLSERDPIYRYRLPTAKEWEYVASCGDYYQYPWGDDLLVSSADSLAANVADIALRAKLPRRREPVSQIDDGFAFTSPVGSFHSPCFDLYDLGGNVAEWVQDDHFREVEGHQIHEKQIKGGSFFSPPKNCLVKSKDFEPPAIRRCGLGFRVAREPK